MHDVKPIDPLFDEKAAANKLSTDPKKEDKPEAVLPPPTAEPQAQGKIEAIQPTAPALPTPESKPVPNPDPAAPGKTEELPKKDDPQKLEEPPKPPVEDKKPEDQKTPTSPDDKPAPPPTQSQEAKTGGEQKADVSLPKKEAPPADDPKPTPASQSIPDKQDGVQAPEPAKKEPENPPSEPAADQKTEPPAPPLKSLQTQSKDDEDEPNLIKSQVPKPQDIDPDAQMRNQIGQPQDSSDVEAGKPADPAMDRSSIESKPPEVPAQEKKPTDPPIDPPAAPSPPQVAEAEIPPPSQPSGPEQLGEKNPEKAALPSEPVEPQSGQAIKEEEPDPKPPTDIKAAETPQPTVDPGNKPDSIAQSPVIDSKNDPLNSKEDQNRLGRPEGENPHRADTSMASLNPKPEGHTSIADIDPSKELDISAIKSDKDLNKTNPKGDEYSFYKEVTDGGEKRKSVASKKSSDRDNTNTKKVSMEDSLQKKALPTPPPPRRDDDFSDDDSIDSDTLESCLKECRVRPILTRQKTEEIEQDLNLNELSGIVEEIDIGNSYRLSQNSQVIEFSCACLSDRENSVFACTVKGALYAIPLQSISNTRTYTNFLIQMTDLLGACDICHRGDLLFLSNDSKLLILQQEGAPLFEYEFKSYEGAVNIGYQMQGPRLTLSNANNMRNMCWWVSHSHFLYFTTDAPFKLFSRCSISTRGKIRSAITPNSRAYSCVDIKRGVALVAYCDDRQDIFGCWTGPGGKGGQLEEARLITFPDPNSPQIKGIGFCPEGFLLLSYTREGPGIDIYSLKQTRAVYCSRVLLTTNFSPVKRLESTTGKYTYGKQVIPTDHYDTHLAKGVRGSSNHPLPKNKADTTSLANNPNLHSSILVKDPSTSFSLVMLGQDISRADESSSSILWKKVATDKQARYETLRYRPNNCVFISTDSTIRVVRIQYS